MKRFKLISLLLVIALLSLSTASAKESEYKVKIDFKYDEIMMADRDTYLVRKEKQYGTLDKNGKTLMKLQSIQLGDCPGGYDLIPICKNGKTGFINRYGKTVIKPIYDRILSFDDGIAVAGKSPKFTCIDTKGKQLFKNKYDYIDSFYGDVAPVMNWKIKGDADELFQSVISWSGCKGYGKWGLIDKKGKVIVDLKYDMIRKFEDGTLFSISKDDKVGFMDETGKIITKPILNDISYFPDNMNLCPVRKGSKWGFIDKTGKVVTKFLWGEEPTPIEGTKLWKVTDTNELGEDYFSYDGIVDDTGKVILDPNFQAIYGFNEGMGIVRKDDDNFGYVNEQGEIFLLPHYYEVKEFREGIAWVYGSIPEENNQFERTEEMDDCLWRPIDQSMNLLSGKGWKNVSDFKDGCAIVSTGDKYTVIDKNMNEVFTSDYEIVEILSSDYFVYKKYDKYGILDNTGKIVYQASFSACTQSNWLPEGIIAYVEKGDWANSQEGLITSEGKLFGNTYWDSFHYDSYYDSSICDNFIMVSVNNKLGLVNLLDGTYAVKPQFEEYEHIENSKGESLWMAKKNGKWGVFAVKVEK